MNKGDLQGKKWQKFLSRVRLFRFVPFMDFVLAAGSLATGNLHENSDFDVIVGVREGKIFTVRFFSVIFFGLPGWRREKLTHGEVASDKICLNHFVAPKRYCLSPPYNEYWQNLYHNLVPILGSREKIDEFFKANVWLTPAREYGIKSYNSNPFHLKLGDSMFKSMMEEILSGQFGSWLEKKLKNVQVKRIEASLPKCIGYKPRIIYNDDELEFHPDTRRIEEMLKNAKNKGDGA